MALTPMEVIPDLTIFLSQRDLPMLLKTTIEPIYISEHHPITMSTEFSAAQSRSQFWHLDPSLLTDTQIASTIHNRLTQYLTENDTPDISPMLKWEAHKCTIRGELIAIASKRKHERQNHISNLANHIHELEKAHKKNTSNLYPPRTHPS